MRASKRAAPHVMTLRGHHAPPAESFPGVGPLLWVVEVALGMPHTRLLIPPLLRHSNAQSGRREGLWHCLLLGSDPMWVVPSNSQLPQDRAPECLGK